MLGLPGVVRACLFDLDGVLTNTAAVHAAAWKEMFDDFLQTRAAERGEEFVPFTPRDYDAYVDGKPRADGTRAFLVSRGVELPEGSSTDAPGTPTIAGLSNKKNELVLTRIARDGVEVFAGSLRYVRAARDAGLRTALVTSSANALQILEATKTKDLFEARIDGVVTKEQGLRGKPAPDTFLAGAQALGVEPQHAAVFEDALAGVAAGRAGNFATVVGVDRVGQAAELRKNGADLVVRDLSELLDSAHQEDV